jgi:hypothetical protein
VHRLQPRVVAAASRRQRALRERARGFDELLVVPQHQRLQRRVGGAAADRAELARRRVEGQQAGGGQARFQ